MASKAKTGLARIRPGSGADQMPTHSALSQAAIPGAPQMQDTLVNLMTGMGTEKDKMTGTVFGYNVLHKSQLDAAYRGDWISRKAVDIPAFDSFREWRTWQADKADISLIEKIEKSTRLLKKSMMANIRGRLYGGGALIMGIDQGKSDEELIIEKLGKDCLKFVHPVSRWDLSSGEIDWDPMSPYFAEPKYYTITSKQGGTSMKVHPSRVVRFLGAEPADVNLSDGWGDSILQICADAIIACGTVSSSTAQLVAEAKIDIVKMPELSEKIVNQDYENRLKRRFGLAATMKSVFGMLIVDKEEEWTRINQTFTGLPDLLKMYLLIVTGAVDVPATRFLGQSPVGMNATGDSDTRNYYDRCSTEQNIVISPAMERLDRVLLRSALGQEPDGVFYEWNPLWQMTDAEKAEIGVKKATIMTADVNAALITPLVLQKARENQLIEDGIYPGLEPLIEEFGDDVDSRQAEAEAAALELAAANTAAQQQANPNALENPAGSISQTGPGLPSKPALPQRRAQGAASLPAPGRAVNKGAANQNTPASKGKAVGDDGAEIAAKRRRSRRTGMDEAVEQMATRIARAVDASTPRTLYIYRPVLNWRDIAKFYKAAGVSNVAGADMHVTVCYSKAAVDWLKVGEDNWGSDDAGNLHVKAGGPRVNEKFGKFLVLAFANSDLSYRHSSILDRCDATWDYDDYTPHVSISKDAGAVDPLTMAAYTGEIVLGPETFEEIKPDQFENPAGAAELITMDHAPPAPMPHFDIHINMPKSGGKETVKVVKRDAQGRPLEIEKTTEE